MSYYDTSSGADFDQSRTLKTVVRDLNQMTVATYGATGAALSASISPFATCQTNINSNTPMFVYSSAAGGPTGGGGGTGSSSSISNTNCTVVCGSDGSIVASSSAGLIQIDNSATQGTGPVGEPIDISAGGSIVCTAGPTGGIQLNTPSAGLVIGYQAGVTTAATIRADTTTTSLVLGGPTGPNVGLYITPTQLLFNGVPVGSGTGGTGAGVQSVAAANGSIYIAGTATNPTFSLGTTAIVPTAISPVACSFATTLGLSSAVTVDAAPFGALPISALPQGYYQVQMRYVINMASDGVDPVVSAVTPGTTITHILEATGGSSNVQNYLQSFTPVPGAANALATCFAPLILTGIIYLTTGTTALVLKAYAVPPAGTTSTGKWAYTRLSSLGGTTSGSNFILPTGA